MQYITDQTKSHHQTLQCREYCNSWPQFLYLSHTNTKQLTRKWSPTSVTFCLPTYKISHQEFSYCDWLLRWVVALHDQRNERNR